MSSTASNHITLAVNSTLYVVHARTQTRLKVEKDENRRGESLAGAGRMSMSSPEGRHPSSKLPPAELLISCRQLPRSSRARTLAKPTEVIPSRDVRCRFPDGCRADVAGRQFPGRVLACSKIHVFNCMWAVAHKHCRDVAGWQLPGRVLAGGEQLSIRRDEEEAVSKSFE